MAHMVSRRDVGGILSKGWPVVMAATDWWRDERRRARWLVLFESAMGARTSQESGDTVVPTSLIIGSVPVSSGVSRYGLEPGERPNLEFAGR